MTIPALSSAVSGLDSEETAMDVIGNNISNSSTTGYKASEVSFQEAFSQMLQGASAPTGAMGGTDPLQVGGGTQVGSIDQLFTQGTLQNTGVNTNLAIQGNSFFVVDNGQQQLYTRDGDFEFDASGDLVMAGSGYIVQGIMADAAGNLSAAGSLTNITIPQNMQSPAKATSAATLSGNLDSAAAVGTTYEMGITAYDSTGAPQALQLTFTNTAPGTWTWAASVGGTPPTATVTSGGTGTATFNSDGSLASFTGGAPLVLTPTDGGAAMDVTLNAGTVNSLTGLTGFAESSNAAVASQNGYAAGTLSSVSINSDGVIVGSFSNGQTQNLAQVGLASFSNPGGLEDTSDNTFAQSANSGQATIGFAGTSDPSSITAGALENSNVDLSTEFSNMIVAERAYQADAEVVTTANTMLQTVVSLPSQS
jgi:flagellar hook protein FlgE